jgi:mono/diheme cytochrome c family protein
MKNKIVLFLSVIVVLVIFITSCQSDAELDYKRYYSAGALIYQSRCQNCHGDKGDGLAGLIPPFTDSLYLRTNRKSLACYVKNGLSEAITLNNKTYTGKMPAQPDFTPVDIAEVLTYVTNSFGNKQGVMDTEQVNANLAGCK